MRPKRQFFYVKPNQIPSIQTPDALVHVLEDPLVALATSVVLKAREDLPAFPDAALLLHSPWFNLYAEVFETSPSTLRSWLGMSSLSTETT